MPRLKLFEMADVNSLTLTSEDNMDTTLQSVEQHERVLGQFLALAALADLSREQVAKISSAVPFVGSKDKIGSVLDSLKTVNTRARDYLELKRKDKQSVPDGELCRWAADQLETLARTVHEYAIQLTNYSKAGEKQIDKRDSQIQRTRAGEAAMTLGGLCALMQSQCKELRLVAG